MRRRLVVDLECATPPEGEFAGAPPRDYGHAVALYVLGLLEPLGRNGVTVTSFAIGTPPPATHPPNPMLADAVRVDHETGEVLA